MNINSTAVYVPVLEPLLVRLNTAQFAAPGLENTSATIPVLAPLPPVPDFSASLTDFAPQVFLPENQPSMFTDVFTLEEFTGVEESLQNIQTVIRSLDEQYGRYWESVNTDPLDFTDAELDCYTPEQGRCIHSELDIIERLTRMFSRPLVYLEEDFVNTGD